MPIYMECRHIKTNGDKCESPALRDGYFCYFHSRLKRIARQQPAGQNDPQSLDLPPLEDSCAIQLALSKVVCAIASGHLDPRRAGMLLYGLQIASQNARNSISASVEPVDEVILTPDGEELGPFQMRCDDDIECDQCDSKDHCDEMEKAAWEAELEQFEEQAPEPGEEQGEKQLPEPSPTHEPRSQQHCPSNCRAASGSQCCEVNLAAREAPLVTREAPLIKSIQPLGEFGFRPSPQGHAPPESS